MHTPETFEKAVKQFLRDYWRTHGQGSVSVLIDSLSFVDSAGNTRIDTDIEWFGDGMAEK